jgi:hypothetical protein
MLTQFLDCPIKSGNDNYYAGKPNITCLSTHHCPDCFVANTPRNDGEKRPEDQPIVPAIALALHASPWQ